MPDIHTELQVTDIQVQRFRMRGLTMLMYPLRLPRRFIPTYILSLDHRIVSDTRVGLISLSDPPPHRKGMRLGGGT